MVWTCDRCGATHETPREVVTEQPWGLAAEVQPRAWSKGPEGWTATAHIDEIEDICPGCLTDGERADQVFSAAELTVFAQMLDSRDES
jgi:hypothetical protein